MPAPPGDPTPPTLTPDPARRHPREWPPSAGTGIWAGRRLRDYLILDQIGQGGMGLVFRARHLRLDSIVALKVLPADRFADAAAVGRFDREMKALGRLDHAHIVRARDAGEADGVHFLVMEWLDGTDLGGLLRRAGPLPIADACEAIRQAALGLQHAHEAGRVHRDLKPSNLFLARGGTIKVLDLGLALILGDALAGPLTPAESAMGTVDYTAPEQWADAHAVDIRADLYSLGCTLYALLAGEPPFGDGAHPTLHAKMRAHLHEPPPPLAGHRPDVPPGLADLLDRLLAKDPGDRPATPAELAGALAPFAAGSDLGRYVDPAGPPTSETITAADPLATTEPTGPMPAPAPTAAVVDEDVQFTVYRPRVVPPGRWTPLLVFAHLSARPDDAPPGTPDPVAEVARQAEQVLGEAVLGRDYQSTVQDSAAAVPREEILTLVPAVEGVEFNPPRRQFRWTETVHREEFRLRAAAALDGKTARGRLSVYLGSILLAEVSLGLKVDSRHVPASDEPTEKTTATRFRRIFASYAQEDRPIAAQFERFAGSLGDEYLSRCTSLRAGDARDDRLRELIAGADVFQLFWSRNALRSSLVERELRHALALNRPDFLRPVYWEDPLPADPGRDLPPAELRRLHFHRLDGVGPATIGLDDDHTPAAVEPLSTELEPAGSAEFATTPAGLAAGTKLGSFVIESPLGQGAMSAVYKAVQEQTGTPVVLKVLPGGPAGDPQAAGRLRREADIFRQFRHPNIVRLLAAGRSGGMDYLATEYVPGSTLEGLLQRRGPLPWKEVADLGIQLCAALQYAHERGILHRDLKPSNLRIDEGGRLKLADFGLARDLEAGAPVGSGRPVGTAAYMAPEQIRGTPALSARTDLYGLGVLLYQMLAGEPPFAGQSVVILMHSHLTQIAPRVGSKVPGVPRAIDDLIAALLAKDPADRPHDAEAVAARLREGLARPSGEDRPQAMPAAIRPPDAGWPAGARDVALEAFPSDTRAMWKGARPAARGRRLAGLVMMPLLGLLAFFGYLSLPRTASDVPTAQPEAHPVILGSQPPEEGVSDLEELEQVASRAAALDRLDPAAGDAPADGPEALYVATRKSADAAEQDGDLPAAAAAWQQMADRLRSAEGGDDRAWSRYAAGQAAAVKTRMESERATVEELLAEAAEQERRGEPAAAAAFREEITRRFGRSRHLGDLLDRARRAPR